MILAALLLLPGAVAAQELGMHGWWVAGDGHQGRGLLGGGAYLAASPLPFLDVRLGYSAAVRTRLEGDRLTCNGAAPAVDNCVAEAVQSESRLSSGEVGAVAWLGVSNEVRVGAGLSVLRHSLSIRDVGVQTNRETRAVVAQPTSVSPALSLHAQVAPRFAPAALVYGVIGRHSLQHGRCEPGAAAVCGSTATTSVRLGVAYRFGNPFAATP